MRRVDFSVLWPAALIAGLLPVLAAVPPVLRYDHLVAAGETWSIWPVTPGITLATLLVLWVYIRGQRGRGLSVAERHGALAHLAFFGGVAAVFLALQSPIETLSDHLFVAHQVEHMLLRTVGPMLLMLAAPQAALLRGLPVWLRRGLVAPLLGSSIPRVLGLLGRPAPATALFIATTYFWMVPRYHDLAILDEPVHYLWHTTLLISGLVFFWRILDPRPYPLGASLGTRLGMFWFASAANILLGSFLSFKHQALYSAYDVTGRFWGMSSLTDEQLGGLTMWIPGSMMFAATAMLMIYRWAQEEERTFARRRNAGVPLQTMAEFVASRRSANRRMAIGLLAFSATVLVITFSVVLTYHYTGTHHIGIDSTLSGF
ncbi:MAG TPA: cytochrome c oxidase assembly protein [Stellaceae bacterium]|jgi:putative membrane protein|nr:cytochrome c oxidase assembly protein [Stellaceae bacterium]